MCSSSPAMMSSEGHDGFLLVQFQENVTLREVGSHSQSQTEREPGLT